MRIICLAYLLLLTLALWVRNPLDWLGERTEAAFHTVAPGVHFSCFLVLTLLALSARWPISRGRLLAMLAVYGLGTEIVQGFLPPRTPELGDLVQDLAGIAVGALLLQAWEWHARRRRADDPPPEAAPQADG